MLRTTLRTRRSNAVGAAGCVMASDQRKRVEVEFLRIERHGDGRRLARILGDFPEIDLVRQIEAPAVAADDYAHAWTVRLRRVHLHDDGHLARVQLDDVP